MLYQSVPFHCPGVGMDLINNALVRHATDGNQSITSNNYPLPPDNTVSLYNLIS